jgi:hypothetical protein
MSTKEQGTQKEGKFIASYDDTKNLDNTGKKEEENLDNTGEKEVENLDNTGKKYSKTPRTRNKATVPKKREVEEEPVDAGTKQEIPKEGAFEFIGKFIKGFRKPSEYEVESEDGANHRRKVREKTTVAELIWAYFWTALWIICSFWFMTLIFGEVWTWRCRLNGYGQELGGPHCDNLKWFLSFSHMVSFGSFGIVISKLLSIVASFA